MRTLHRKSKKIIKKFKSSKNIKFSYNYKIVSHPIAERPFRRTRLATHRLHQRSHNNPPSRIGIPPYLEEFLFSFLFSVENVYEKGFSQFGLTSLYMGRFYLHERGGYYITSATQKIMVKLPYNQFLKIS